jgi:SAM-dependent methyltransferase
MKWKCRDPRDPLSYNAVFDISIHRRKMSGCCPHSSDAGRFFSLFARRYRRRFQKKGLEPSQRQLVTGIREGGLENASLLEIGCGVGYLHQSLLEVGAARAAGIDLSERMLEQARDLAKERGLEARTDYRQGDFVDLADSLDTADVVILDKVICCYPDWQTLVDKSLAKAKRVYAFTIPRDRWFVRLGVALTVVGLWLLRSRFRPYVHDPNQIDSIIATRGFTKRYQNQTVMWRTQVFIRA